MFTITLSPNPKDPVMAARYVDDGDYIIFSSVLWRCWLSHRKGIRPVKTEWWDDGMVLCLGQSADLHMAELMPLPLTGW